MYLHFKVSFPVWPTFDHYKNTQIINLKIYQSFLHILNNINYMYYTNVFNYINTLYFHYLCTHFSFSVPFDYIWILKNSIYKILQYLNYACYISLMPFIMQMYPKIN